MALRNVYGELALDSTLQSLRMAVQALTRTLGLIMPDSLGRARISLDAAPAVVSAAQSGTWTLTTVTTVTTLATLTNQGQIGGYGANDQVPALMHLSADSLRRNITVN